ncbi:MAG: HAMP domain-containing protein [Nitrospirae bacterium]|nr:HAMP domain-containing protein [Nitrospirota bacterium]
MSGVGLRTKVTAFVSCLVVAIISINAAITIRTERQERESQLLEQGRLFARLTATDVVRAYGSRPWETSGDAGQPPPETPGGAEAGPPGGTSVKRPWDSPSEGAGSPVLPPVTPVQPGAHGSEPAPGQLDRQMARFFDDYPDLTRLMILSGNGLVLYDSDAGETPDTSIKHTEDKDLMNRLARPEMDIRRTDGPDGQKYMDIIAPVTEAGGPQFLKVRYIISYHSLEQRLAGIRREFLLLAGFFIALGIAAATIFSGRLTRPIMELKEGAGEIARGNLEHTVNIASKDEIGELGRSFNRMALSLKEHRREIEEANRNLLAANEELVSLQKELVRSERMAAVGQLAAGLSHEIDNPIGVILGFAEYLLEDMPAGDPRREDLVTIVEESKRCKNIVRGLLDFSRPPVLGVVSTDIYEVVRRTVDAVRSQPIFKKVRITTEAVDGIPAIMADPGRLRQVFMNLMINSAQAMAEGGDLNVSVVHEPGAEAVRVVFSDTGTGIPPENLDKVFDPFFTTKRAGEGTGLGLAICARLLDEQGGTIQAESGPGPGATFTVTLPVNGGTPAGQAETA